VASIWCELRAFVYTLVNVEIRRKVVTKDTDNVCDGIFLDYFDLILGEEF
jgi:hypothetical protein